MDRRVYPGLVAGVGGLTAGTGAAVLGSPVLAVLSGAAALVAGASAVTGLRRLHVAEAPSAPATLLDRATGLPAADYFTLAVQSRIRSARRRVWPVTVVVVEVVYQRERRDDVERRDAATTAAALQRVARDADEIALIRPGCFGMILEDASEAQALSTIDRLQTVLADEVAGIDRLAAGIATYPSSALDAENLVGRAEEALRQARIGDVGQRVIVAQPD